MASYGWVSLHIKPLLLGGVLSGGVIFGWGWRSRPCRAPRGGLRRGPSRCDGGRVRLLQGASIYVAAWPLLRRSSSGRLRQVTLPQVTGIPEWFWIMALVFGVGSLGHRRAQYEKTRQHPSDAAPAAHAH